jgi:dGTPase
MMTWDQLLNSSRLGNRPAKAEAGRSPFASDQDKVIFSGAFRRLARKTQVHPLATNDHVHNRLTHSLEVASVGRSLGAAVGHALKEKGRLPQGCEPAQIGEIVQAACLAHDIGNPPFGHTGEDAIRRWFSSDAGDAFLAEMDESEKADLKNFEGNAQGFRVVACSEMHPNDGGLRLTYATLATFIKYPWTSLATRSDDFPKKNKYGVYQAELPLFSEVAAACGLRRLGTNWYSRHPLAHLVELADDFCYALLDLEDGLEMDILSWSEVFDVVRPVLSEKEVIELEGQLKTLGEGRLPPLIRGKVIAALVENAAEAFVDHEAELLKGELHELLGRCSPIVAKCVNDAKELAKKRIFVHPRKIELEVGAHTAIATLLSTMCHAVHDRMLGKRSDHKTDRVIAVLGEGTFEPRMGAGGKEPSKLYPYIMRVLDFVAGMTDNYAVHLAKQLGGRADQ